MTKLARSSCRARVDDVGKVMRVSLMMEPGGWKNFEESEKVRLKSLPAEFHLPNAAQPEGKRTLISTTWDVGRGMLHNFNTQHCRDTRPTSELLSTSVLSNT